MKKLATNEITNVVILDSERVHYLDGVELEQKILGRNTNIQLIQDLNNSNYDDILKAAHGVIAYHSILVDKSLINKLKNCRGLVKATIGFDEVDVKYLSACNIPCCNVPGCGVEEVADHTMALILTLNRRLLSFHQEVQKEVWSWRSGGPLSSLKKQTLGLIGFGEIGKAVARRAQQFGMTIIIYDPFIKPLRYRRKKIGFYSSFQDLLSNSNIISLHAPLTKDTFHLLSIQEFNCIKPGSTLINTARGKLIDTNALIVALQKGIISHAGLDVIDSEPIIPTELLKNPNVIITPHAAFYSEDSLFKLRFKATTSLLKLLEGKLISSALNPSTLMQSSKLGEQKICLP